MRRVAFALGIVGGAAGLFSGTLVLLNADVAFDTNADARAVVQQACDTPDSYDLTIRESYPFQRPANAPTERVRVSGDDRHVTFDDDGPYIIRGAGKIVDGVAYVLEKEGGQWRVGNARYWRDGDLAPCTFLRALPESASTEFRYLGLVQLDGRTTRHYSVPSPSPLEEWEVWVDGNGRLAQTHVTKDEGHVERRVTYSGMGKPNLIFAPRSPKD